MKIKFEEYIKEEFSAISNPKLRNSIHDVITSLGEKQIINVEELSDILMSDYKIIISPSFLDSFLDSFLKIKAGDKNVYSMFTKQDLRWFGITERKGEKIMRNNLYHQKPSLAKYKRKLYADDVEKRLDTEYNRGMTELNFDQSIIKKTFVLQHPDNAKEMMKTIYNDIILQKKYENTPENCWKMMYTLGKNENFDRKRGFFEYAPQKIKNDFNNTKKINVELTRVEPNKKSDVANTKTTTNLVKKPIAPSGNKLGIKPEPKIFDSNIKFISRVISHYPNWEACKNDLDFNRLNNIIKTLDIPHGKYNNVNIILDEQIRQFKAVLFKYYGVSGVEVDDFFFEIGFNRQNKIRKVR